MDLFNDNEVIGPFIIINEKELLKMTTLKTKMAAVLVAGTLAVAPVGAMANSQKAATAAGAAVGAVGTAAVIANGAVIGNAAVGKKVLGWSVSNGGWGGAAIGAKLGAVATGAALGAVVFYVGHNVLKLVSGASGS